MPKPVYVPTVAEATLTVDRSTAWRALLDLLQLTDRGDTRRRALAATEITETAVSLEPPWRLVLDATGGASPFHQETVVFVPDPAGCLAMWSALVLEPTDSVTRDYAEIVARQTPGRLRELTDRLAD